jgi:hypothetical protein
MFTILLSSEGTLLNYNQMSSISLEKSLPKHSQRIFDVLYVFGFLGRSARVS